MKVIGVCGYGFTGSGAVHDMLSSYKEVSVFAEKRNDEEFVLVYTPDGIDDLYHNLVETPVKHLRSDIAIKRFMNMVFALKRAFDRETDGAFSNLSEEYIQHMIQLKWKGVRFFDVSAK